MVRLITSDGSMVGVVSLPEALEAAEVSGLDLVEVSPNADPPVCKVMDYGKHKYLIQKKQTAARKHQKTTDLKEIKLRLSINENDYNIKVKNAQRFLGYGDKVKVTIRFRGREMLYQERGVQLLERMHSDLDSLAKIESKPNLEGRQAIMVLVPR